LFVQPPRAGPRRQAAGPASRSRSVPNPKSAVRNRRIGFVSPKSRACPIHHKSLPAKHLSRSVAPGNWVCLYNCLPATGYRLPPFGFVSHDTLPRAPAPGYSSLPKFGFVSHDGLQVRSHLPVRRQVGFVLHNPQSAIEELGLLPERHRATRRCRTAGPPNWVRFCSWPPTTDYRLLSLGFLMSSPCAFK
jgi:hypothetical protein